VTWFIELVTERSIISRFKVDKPCNLKIAKANLAYDVFPDVLRQDKICYGLKLS